MIFDIGLEEARDIPQGKSRILTQYLLHNDCMIWRVASLWLPNLCLSAGDDMRETTIREFKCDITLCAKS